MDLMKGTDGEKDGRVAMVDRLLIFAFIFAEGLTVGIPLFDAMGIPDGGAGYKGGIPGMILMLLFAVAFFSLPFVSLGLLVRKRFATGSIGTVSFLALSAYMHFHH